MKRFRYEYKRGHGPGGQHKNKTESCVTAIDPETGFTETCQETPSQHRNKKLATDRLAARVRVHHKGLTQMIENERRIKSLLPGVIRTYNYARNEVKDHRTGKKANLKKVLDGNLNLIK